MRGDSVNEKNSELYDELSEARTIQITVSH